MADEYSQEVMSSTCRVFPCKIIFVHDIVKYDVVLDLGFGITVKQQLKLDSVFSVPDRYSDNVEERKAAKAAKFFVMDVFMGLAGGCAITKSNQNYYAKSMVFPGTTAFDVALVGDGVEMGKYMEVMRAFDFDRVYSDFVSTGRGH
jgi:hypothetical protein